MSLSSSAKVNFVTSKGTIEVDLYAAQVPNLCRSFISNCMNKKFVGCSFGKITSDLVQVHGSFDSTPIARETHSRLKFDGKGDVGILNLDDSNKATASGFFITTQPCPHFNSRYTIIGKISSDSMYNVMKLVDCEKKEDGETPVFPVQITDVLTPLPYFEDITVERSVEQPAKPPAKKQKKNLRLDFGEDEEDDLQDSGFKIKSAHELKRNKNSQDPTPLASHEMVSTEHQVEIIDQNMADKQSSEIASSADLKSLETKGLNEDCKTESGKADNNEQEKEDAGEKAKTNDESEEEAVPFSRDPSIDPYDPLLDISKDEVSFTQLQLHYFNCR